MFVYIMVVFKRVGVVVKIMCGCTYIYIPAVFIPGVLDENLI